MQPIRRVVWSLWTPPHETMGTLEVAFQNGMIWVEDGIPAEVADLVRTGLVQHDHQIVDVPESPTDLEGWECRCNSE